MMQLLRPFSYGLIGGMVGAALNWFWGMIMEQRERPPTMVVGEFLMILMQMALAVVASATGVLMGFRLSPKAARELGMLPGFLLGTVFLALIPGLGTLPWFLLSLSPAMASGAAACARGAVRPAS